ncbi:MAG: hypothetical protein MJ048_01900 [Acidaminococcaceae bacterium]|nr:hypothetical protein [Acidaminococcaceae bacterium]
MSKQQNKYKGYLGPEDVTGIGQYFGLARPFNLDDKITRYTLLSTVLAFCAEACWKLTQNVPVYDACLAGISVGFSLLLSFMLGMELDPDRKIGGIIGGILATGWAFWQGEPNFIVMLLLIFVLRMLNRSSGDKHKLFDNVLMLLCAWWLGQDGGWLYPMMLAAAYIIESQLHNGAFYSLYLAAFALGALWFSNGITKEPALLSMHYIIILAASIILFLPMLRMSLLVETKGDRSIRRLDGQRLRASNLFFIVSIFFITFFQGNAQGQNLAPAIFTAAGVGIYSVYALVRKRKN